MRPLPLSQRSPNPLPFLLPDLEPHDPKTTESAHALVGTADVDARPSRASAVTRNTQGAEKRTFIALHGSSLDSISHDSTSLCCSSIKPRASYSRASMYSYSSLHQR